MEKIAAHLVEVKFYNSCRKHEKAETLFCINCLSHPFCENCVADSKHWDHQHLQVFKASRKEVVRVKDVENLWNISNIQPFIINNRKVIYINERETKGDPSCSICSGRKLEDKHEFCSIQCQVKRNRELNKDSNRRMKGEYKIPSSSSSNNNNNCLSPPSKRNHRRKCVPVRAPFF